MVTYSDLIQFGIFIVTLIGLCYQIFKGKRKQPPLLAIMTAVQINSQYIDKGKPNFQFPFSIINITQSVGLYKKKSKKQKMLNQFAKVPKQFASIFADSQI